MPLDLGLILLRIYDVIYIHLFDVMLYAQSIVLYLPYLSIHSTHSETNSRPNIQNPWKCQPSRGIESRYT